MAERPGEPQPLDESPGGTVSSRTRPAGATGKVARWLVGPILLGHLLALYLPGGPSLPEPPYVDKFVHAALFGVPVWVLGRLTGRIWLVGGIFAVHAVLSELIQYWLVPNRDGDLFDAAADFVGIGLALWWLHRTRKEG